MLSAGHAGKLSVLKSLSCCAFEKPPKSASAFEGMPSVAGGSSASTALARGAGVVPSGVKAGRKELVSMLKKVMSLKRKPCESEPPKATMLPP
jgi:hypothetical protein